MNADQFYQAHGRDETERVCRAAGTSIVYFEQCLAGKRNFSPRLAARLEQASAGRMDRVALVFGSNPPPPVEVAIEAENLRQQQRERRVAAQ